MSRFRTQGKSFEKLIRFCAWHSVSFEVDFSEPDDCMSVCVGYKPTDQEYYYEKRVYSLDDFLVHLQNSWVEKGLTVVSGWENY